MRATPFRALLASFMLGGSLVSHAQVSWTAKAARELVEATAAKGGAQAARQLAELGGAALARESLEKALQEGGEALAQKLVSRSLEYGPAILKVARSSPSRFVAAFDELSPALRQAAAHAITREPDRMARLFADLGKNALLVAALHPGVGTPVLEALGREGAETLARLNTDQAVRLSRIAPQLARVAEPQRRELLALAGRAPGRILDLLEAHPKVLLTSAGVASFLALKDELLGTSDLTVDEDGMVRGVSRPGFIERVARQTAQTFHKPLAALIWIAGVILLAAGAIKLWALFRKGVSPH
jgi:hypothetical protein